MQSIEMANVQNMCGLERTTVQYASMVYIALLCMHGLDNTIHCYLDRNTVQCALCMHGLYKFIVQLWF